ncbi:beta-2-microglobulin [Leuresthes tenuis]|uniref:beta-2-microglobulin n=1 Tax=Leuresthes tenuis TaxID=355514 RepID=UPI003B514094
MKPILCLVALFATLLSSVDSKETPPKVQVYSRDPGEFGKQNTLICHVSNFHPPDITIELTEDGNVLPDAKQTDLAFKQDWHFHLTKSVAFTPVDGHKYNCRVTHGKTTKEYAWESNM